MSARRVGLANRQIAEPLFISERTAQNSVQHILTAPPKDRTGV